MKEDQVKAAAIIQERDYGSLDPGDSNCDDSNSEEKWWIQCGGETNRV